MPLTEVTPTIRPAWPDEVARATRLFRLPDHCHSLWVATISPRDRLVGCAALVEAARPVVEAADRPRETAAAPHPGPAFLLWRAVPGREGLLGELIRHAIEAAVRQGHSEIKTLDLLPEADPMGVLLGSLDFQPAETLHEFTMPMSTVHRRIGSLYDRLTARGSIPPGMRITHLEADLVPEVRRIVHVAGLLNATDFDARLAGRAATAFSPDLCTIIAAEGAIVGIHLVELTADGASIPCRWVHHDHRHSWVNIALMALSARSATATHPERTLVHFTFNSEHHGETQRFARRMDAQPTGARSRLALKLTC